MYCLREDLIAYAIRITQKEPYAKAVKHVSRNWFYHLQVQQGVNVSKHISDNKAVLDFFELKTELESLKGTRSDDEKNVTKISQFAIFCNFLTRRCLGRLKRTI